MFDYSQILCTARRTVGAHRSLAALLAMGLMPMVASAGVAQTSSVSTIEIRLSNFRFDPSEIRLVHGRRYVLHFVNTAGGGHDFVAKRFFAAAGMGPDDRKLVDRGEIALQGGEQATVTLVAPAPDDYAFHCSHFLHQTFGMRGRFVVQ